MFAWWLPGDPPAGAGPGGCRGILRQVPGLDPAAGLLVVLVVVVALVVLFFARVPVPWSGSLRCSWPCCRPSSAWSCRLPPVRIAAGVVVPVGVVVALVVLVAVKEQGGRVIGGRSGPAWCRVCCSPGRADLGPGCSTRCRIAGGVAGVRLVLAG